MENPHSKRQITLRAEALQCEANKFQISIFNFLNFGFVILVLFVICNLFFGASPSWAIGSPRPVWPANGLVINDTPGNAAQQNPKIASDGRSGYFVVWEDSRYGDNSLFLQKIDESGNLLWSGNGIAVARARGAQNAPQIIADGGGGVIVAWQDYRHGNSDIYAQRFASDGSPLWAAGGVAVCAAPTGQFAPVMTGNGAGGAIIAWHDYRSNVGEDIYAQQIDKNGGAAWKENGLPICAASGTQWYPTIAGDGSGGAVITWTDGRGGSADNNIYAQRINGSGSSLWAKDGLPVCQSGNNQEKPLIAAVDDGWVIAWSDNRSGNPDIYLQKIGPDGSGLWAKDGVAACALAYVQESYQLADDGAGGAIVTWSDWRDEAANIFAQRIYSNGRPAWQDNGLPLARNKANQKNPVIAKMANETWVVVWEDYRSGKAKLIAQKINSTGALIWNKLGLVVAGAPQQELPMVAAAGNGGLVIAWQDGRRGNYDIYSQKLSADGDLLWTKNGLLVCAALGSVVQQNLRFAPTSNNEVIMAFEDARAGNYNIFVQKVSRSGSLSWGANALPVSRSGNEQTNSQVVADNSGGAYICWEEKGTIKAQRLSSSGKPLWGGPLSVGPGGAKQSNPLMISDGKGGAILVWIDERNPLSLHDLYGQRINPAGEQLWGKKGKPVTEANGNQSEPVMISDDNNGAIVCWTDYRNGDRNPDIYAQRLSAGGVRLWNNEDVLVCGAPDVQRRPALAGDGEGGAMVAWTDKGGGSYDIYAQRLSASGQALWMKDGIPVSQLSRTQQNPKFGNKNVLVWEDYRFGNWDIFAGAVSSGGKLMWGENGVSVASVPFTQYAPECSAVPWNNGTIIVWEDYRSGKQYEIYVQMIDGSGQTSWTENGLRVSSQNGARSPKVLTIPQDKTFYVFWDDYTNGGRAIFGQRFIIDQVESVKLKPRFKSNA